ncbi:histone-lysine N-methyltransferase SETMAR-like [Parasteatoda tepidariorum]|uniref:histone-lysine N-methyltransferase SETMAR-like n=1 Tax=Parasteatoda tepidariorum TaxID=114398 RepID=UPI0039BD0D04
MLYWVGGKVLSSIDSDVLQSMLENNPRLTSREIAEEFGIHRTTVGHHIKSLGFVLKQSVWVPHEITENNLSDRVRMCSSHLIRHNMEPFLDRLVTGDEKWILYENIRKGPVYHKLQKQGKTINADLYCNQLDKLNAAIKEKRPTLASRKGIVFHHDNARPHTACVPHTAKAECVRMGNP